MVYEILKINKNKIKFDALCIVFNINLYCFAQRPLGFVWGVIVGNNIPSMIGG